MNDDLSLGVYSDALMMCRLSAKRSSSPCVRSAAQRLWSRLRMKAFYISIYIHRSAWRDPL